MARPKFTPYPLTPEVLELQVKNGIPEGCQCCHLMYVKGSKKRIPCPKHAIRMISGSPYCDQHGKSKKPANSKRPSMGPRDTLVKPSRGKPYQPDPYYQTPEWRMLRFDTLRRDKNTCRYCGAYAHQADHVIPRKRGGLDALSNLVACCSSCNRVAGNREFKTIEQKKRWILIHRDL